MHMVVLGQWILIRDWNFDLFDSRISLDLFVNEYTRDLGKHDTWKACGKSREDLGCVCVQFPLSLQLDVFFFYEDYEHTEQLYAWNQWNTRRKTY